MDVGGGEAWNLLVVKRHLDFAKPFSERNPFAEVPLFSEGIDVPGYMPSVACKLGVPFLVVVNLFKNVNWNYDIFASEGKNRSGVIQQDIGVQNDDLLDTGRVGGFFGGQGELQSMFMLRF
jgi:hypothetical protein